MQHFSLVMDDNSLKVLDKLEKVSVTSKRPWGDFTQTFRAVHFLITLENNKKNFLFWPRLLLSILLFGSIRFKIVQELHSKRIGKHNVCLQIWINYSKNVWKRLRKSLKNRFVWEYLQRKVSYELIVTTTFIKFWKCSSRLKRFSHSRMFYCFITFSLKATLYAHLVLVQGHKEIYRFYVRYATSYEISFRVMKNLRKNSNIYVVIDFLPRWRRNQL